MSTAPAMKAVKLVDSHGKNIIKMVPVPSSAKPTQIIPILDSEGKYVTFKTTDNWDKLLDKNVHKDGLRLGIPADVTERPYRHICTLDLNGNFLDLEGHRIPSPPLPPPRPPPLANA